MSAYRFRTGKLQQISLGGISLPETGSQYWRLFFAYNGSDTISASRIQMFAATLAEGGAASTTDLATGRTGDVIVSSATRFTPGDGFPGNLVDVSSTSFWQATTTTNAWAGINFGEPTVIRGVSVSSRGGGFGQSQSPRALRVDKSDDGVSWTTEWDQGDIGTWSTAVGQTKRYDIPS